MSTDAPAADDTIRLLRQRAAPPPALPQRRLLGMPLHALTLAEAVTRVFDELDAGRGGCVLTPNIDILRRYLRSPELHAMFERNEVLVTDGMPLVVALRLARTPVPAQVTGTDLLRELAASAAVRGRAVALAGGPPGTAERAIERLAETSPGLRAHPHPCYVRPESQARELAALAEVLVASRPEIVFVGLPFDAQVALVNALRERLPGTWFVGVGSSFELVNGERERPPHWVQRACLEWAWRLGAQPGLWRRYLVHGIPVAVRLLAWALRTRWRGPGKRVPGPRGAP